MTPTDANWWQGRRALVTGAAGGIGGAAARRLHGLGATVLGVDITADPAAAFPMATADVSDRDQIGSVVRGFGDDGGLDVLVVSAAVYGDAVSIDELTPADVERVLSVNIAGTLWTAQAALPYLRESRGSIVAVGSLAGRMGGVLAGAHYAGSKGAVHSIVRSLAKTQAEYGVRANGVAPGAVDTPMVAGRGYHPEAFPQGRFATPDEIVDGIVFLAAPTASYVNGVVLDVNGGLYVH